MAETRRRPRRWIRRAAGVGVLVGLALAVLPLVVVGPVRDQPPVAVTADAVSREGSERLRIATLNLAHGRRDGFHQLFQGEGAARTHLAEAAAALRRWGVDVVGLQEADGPSFWSGGFDHVATLAREGGFGWRVRGRHVEGFGLSYGTALLSRLPLEEPESRTFGSSWPSFPKGFVVAAFRWPGRPDLAVDLVSVHLDFLRPAVRRMQVEGLLEALSSRDRPRIVVGDFNAGWAEEGTVARLCRDLGLVACRPEEGTATFPVTGERIDWILVSPRFRFVVHEVAPETLSDHRALVAELTLVGS